MPLFKVISVSERRIPLLIVAPHTNEKIIRYLFSRTGEIMTSRMHHSEKNHTKEITGSIIIREGMADDRGEMEKLFARKSIA